MAEERSVDLVIIRRMLVCSLLLAGCLDKAKADYDRCVERDVNYDVAGAASACAAAVAADPKSPSGQAAAKKLVDLQTVSARLKNERDEKTAREANIKKDEPPQVIVHAAPSATVAVDVSPIGQAQALYASGDAAGARALLEPRIVGGTGTMQEGKLLATICKAQKDNACLKMLAKKLKEVQR